MTFMAVPAMALLSRVFFTTWYWQPLARNSRRRAVSALTVIPRKSVITTLVALASSSFSAAMFSSLTSLSMGLSLVSSGALYGFQALLGLVLGDQRVRIDL